MADGPGSTALTMSHPAANSVSNNQLENLQKEKDRPNRADAIAEKYGAPV